MRKNKLKSRNQGKTVAKEMTIEERIKEENKLEKRSMKREISGGNFTPLEIMPHCFAAGLDFRIIPAGFNAPVEFLTGFTLEEEPTSETGSINVRKYMARRM
jgi:hypothetical protein